MALEPADRPGGRHVTASRGADPARALPWPRLRCPECRATISPVGPQASSVGDQPHVRCPECRAFFWSGWRYQVLPSCDGCGHDVTVGDLASQAPVVHVAYHDPGETYGRRCACGCERPALPPSTFAAATDLADLPRDAPVVPPEDIIGDRREPPGFWSSAAELQRERAGADRLTDDEALELAALAAHLVRERGPGGSGSRVVG